MKYLLTGVLALTLITACNQNDKTAPGGVLAASEFSVDALPKITLRKGDPATAGAALSAFSLSDSGSGRVSFANKEVSGDTAVFTDVTLLSGDTAIPAEALEGMRLEAGPEGLTFDGADIKAGKLEFEGLGITDGQANFARMVLTDVTVATDDSAGAPGKIKSIELVNPSPEMAAWVASLLGKGEPADFPAGEAMSFDLWAMNELAFNIDDASGEGAFMIEKIEMAGLKENSAGLMSMSDLVFDFKDASDGTEFAMKLDSFGVRGIDMKFVDAARAASASGSSSELANMLQTDPTNPGYDAMSLKGFSLAVAGADFALPALDARVTRDDQGRAIKQVTAPFTMTLASQANPAGEQLSAALASLGYEKLELTAAGESLYDPDKDLVTLVKGKNYWALNDGFKMDVSAKYEGAKAMALATQSAGFEANPVAGMQEAFSALSIHGLELAFDDNGFFDRALNAYAAQAGSDPAELRTQMSGFLAAAPMMAGSVGIDPAIVTELATALSSFVAEPKTLTIAIAPQTPFKPMDYADPAQLSNLKKDTLGFSAGNK